MVELEAVTHHSHYDPTGKIRIYHAPGDRYTVDDGGGMTARQLAAAFIGMGFAKPVGPKSKPTPKAAK
jgi:hypothetical protein